MRIPVSSRRKRAPLGQVAHQNPFGDFLGNVEDFYRRLDALSEGELDSLAASLDEAQAGGDGLGTVVTAILIVFLVLLATDILGFTKVFPFTRSVR